jgi:hypothetical protein
VTALTLFAVVAAMGVAACGSSSTSSSSSSAAASAGGAPNSAARTKLAACLKQHGVTLPARPAGARTPTPGQGGYGPPPGGGPGFFGGGGRGAGTGAGERFSNLKTRAAFQACAKAAGLNFRGRRSGGNFRPSQAAIAKFASCVKQHGYTLPKANLSGKGPVYPAKIERNETFRTAARACQSVLRPAGGGAGRPGAPPPGA